MFSCLSKSSFNFAIKDVDLNSPEYHKLDKLSLDKLQSKLKNLNPSLHNTTDLLIKDRVIKAILVARQSIEAAFKINQPQINSLNLGVSLKREEIEKVIKIRLKKRLESGMIEEVEDLLI